MRKRKRRVDLLLAEPVEFNRVVLDIEAEG